ncbi:MAG: potassium-transporting ATPase subunit KdpA [Candidatus Aminicenantales bacterium]
MAMNLYGWLQLVLFIGLVFAVAKPVGLYLVRVLEPEGKTWLDRPIKPVEQLIYRVLRVDPKVEQDWPRYAMSLLVFSLAGMLFTYAVLRLQHLLPLNPQHFGPVRADLAFNTAASFTTNTNWQNYAGESTLSYFSQMVGLVFHNFVSAAAGIAAAAALVRGIARHSAKTLGNFWVDLVRINLYILLPISIVFSLFLTSQGMIQNFKPSVQAATIESATGLSPDPPGAVQTIAQGPVASQAAIKILGTNGGGFFNANAAHPYENPTPLSNFIQMLSIFLIPSGLTYYLGRKVRNQKHGWAVWSAMAILFLAAALVCWKAEAAGNTRLQALGVDAAGGNMEGKEVRFGIAGSSLFATVTTAASCGAVNAMHDSFTPLGGLVPLVNIQLGEVVFGGVGSGLYGMLVFVILAVFLTGLMVGRTPEYLGKKIESYDVKVSVLAVLILIFSILGFSAWAATSRWGLAGLANSGPHGLSEILYAFSSGTGNNGSAFAGLNGNTPFYNITLALAMLFGRFIMMVPVLALAGNMARKKLVPPSEASFPASGPTFVIILIGTVLIVGALTFLPALALGPIVEHLLMTGSGVLY